MKEKIIIFDKEIEKLKKSGLKYRITYQKNGVFVAEVNIPPWLQKQMAIKRKKR